MKYVVVFEFHSKEDRPKVYGPFTSREDAQLWLREMPKGFPFTSPHQFAGCSIQLVESV